MWNPFKTLTERDSARLRRLERTVSDISDDVEQLLNLWPKLNARLRQRARRAGEATSDDADRARDDADGDQRDNVGVVASVPHLEQSETAPVKYTKDQLRGFARARGIIR